MKTQAGAPAMELGMHSMDESHRLLMEALEKALAASDTGFPAAYVALVAHIERDFASEEDAMEEMGFPELKMHREQHARVLAALHYAEACVRGGDVATGRQALLFLPQWFHLHIVTMDAALAAALLMRQGAGDALAEAQP